MRRSKLCALCVGAILAGRTSPVFAKQWKVTLEKVSVAPTKATGKPWDGDGSPPDVVGSFGLGRRSGGRCAVGSREPIAKRQDTSEFAPETSIVTEADDPSELCFSITLADKDIAADDPIGSLDAVVASGARDLEVGSATVTIRAEAAAGDVVDAPPITLPPPPTPRPALYKVSLTTARIHPTKTDTVTWDEPTDKDAEDARVLKSLVSIGLAATGVSALAALMGGDRRSGPTYKAMTVAAPDPRVVIRWGGLTFTTPTAKNTLNPKWDFEFLVPVEIAERKTLRIDVLDADDGQDENIGSDSLSGKDVVKEGVFRKGFGGVEEIVLEIEKVAEDAVAAEKTIKIDTTRGWADTGVDLVAGQTVQITATGTHCLPGGRCMNPDGANSIAFEEPEQEDGTTPPLHAGQLGAFVGGDVFPIGRAAEFKVKASGGLRLGVASKASSGSLAATVRVFYPLRDQ